MVDAKYYMYDTGARHGMNLDKIFDEVHEANRRKFDFKNGATRREDGKIMKPPGWQPADIDAEVSRQCQNGSWEFH